MNTTTKVILSCIDGSSVSTAVCDYASWISHKTGSPLTLLHAIEHTAEPATMDLSGAIGLSLGSRDELLEELTELEQSRSRLLIKQGQHILKAAQQHVNNAGIAAPEICQRHGSLAENLIDMENRIECVVLGIRGQSHDDSDDTGISSHLESIIRAIHTPILVVNTHFTPPRKVMLAYDDSPACEKALAMLISGKLFQGIDCHLVHVGQQGQDFLNNAAHALNDAGFNTKTAQIEGKIDEALANYQCENAIDLMIMGAFSHTRLRNLLMGSFTTRMLARTQRPLLLLR